jgi:hypothetical protein
LATEHFLTLYIMLCAFEISKALGLFFNLYWIRHQLNAGTQMEDTTLSTFTAPYQPYQRLVKALWVRAGGAKPLQGIRQCTRGNSLRITLNPCMLLNRHSREGNVKMWWMEHECMELLNWLCSLPGI